MNEWILTVTRPAADINTGLEVVDDFLDAKRKRGTRVKEGEELASNFLSTFSKSIRDQNGTDFPALVRESRSCHVQFDDWF